jgi:hypothetical protein
MGSSGYAGYPTNDTYQVSPGEFTEQHNPRFRVYLQNISGSHIGSWTASYDVRLQVRATEIRSRVGAP